MENKIEVRVNNGKYGIVDTVTEQVIIPFEYDNIFKSAPRVKYDFQYIVCKSGKVGAVYINSDNSYNWIAPCEYDCYRGNWDLAFYNEREIRYYFGALESCRFFSDIHFIDPFKRYIFAEDNDFYYILRAETGETLWCDLKFDLTDKYSCGAPCLVYMGEVNDLPLFFDCTNGEYILPNDKGKIEHGEWIGNVIKPIIVGGINIVNIVDGSDGVGVLDIRRETHNETKCDYDEVTIELKVNLKKGEHTEERIYQIPNGKFKLGNVIDYGEWY